MAGKSSVPHWVYYVVAVLCTLATVPMYRYMLAHASDRSDPSLPPVREHLFVEPSELAVASPATVLKPLLSGELCEGGYVILRSGNVYTQGIGADGQPARCSGAYVIVRQR